MNQKVRAAGWIAMLTGLMIVESGCGTLASVAGDATGRFEPEGPHRIPRVYSGIATDWSFLSEGGEDAGVLVFDLPLSFAADTLVLPYTIPRQRKYGDLYNGTTNSPPNSP